MSTSSAGLMWIASAVQVTTGARSDLQRATRWARHMVAECGMSDAIGPLFADQHVRTFRLLAASLPT